jgi:Skp family chaperone for outer membrane proteins
MAARLAAAALLLLALAAPGSPQEATRPAFVYLDQERILTGSERGRALLAEEEAARERLRAEARAIETAFEAEERALTERRAEVTPEAFRALADDFDARVVAARREQDERAAALALEFDQRRRAFYADVAPILVRVMESMGALAILDETIVLLADQTLDVTDEVIAWIDRAALTPPAGADDAGPAPEGPAAGTE